MSTLSEHLFKKICIQELRGNNYRSPYQWCGFYLNTLVILINKLPLLILPDSYDCFESTQKTYDTFRQAYSDVQNAIADSEATLSEDQWRFFIGCSEQLQKRKKITSDHLLKIIHQATHSLREEEIRKILSEPLRLTLEQAKEEEEDTKRSASEEESLLKKLKQEIAHCVEKVEAKVEQKRQAIVAQSLRTQHQQLERTLSLDQRHTIYHLYRHVKRWQQACHSFATLTQNAAAVAACPLPPLIETDYGYLTLLSELFTPAGMLRSLQANKGYWRTRFLSRGRRYERLQTTLEADCEDAVRCMRTMIQLGLWKITVLQKNPLFVSDHELGFKHLVDIERTLILVRPLFFQNIQNINSQSAETIINLLDQEQRERAESLSAVAFYNKLLKKRILISYDVHRQERLPLRRYPFWQRGLAQFIVSGQSLIGYQTGRWTAHTISQAMTHSGLPILKTELPAFMEEAVQWGSGLGCILVDVTLASWVGSSYQLLMLLNRIVLSYSEFWQRLGNLLEIPNQQVGLPLLRELKRHLPQQAQPLIVQLEQWIRTDEIGLIEKQACLSWLLGLLLQLSFSYTLQGSESLLPVTVGYGLATLARALTEKVVNTFCKEQQASFRQGLQLVSQLISYSVGYQLGVAFGRYVQGAPQDPSVMTETEALTVLNLPEKSSVRDIQSRYRFLSLKNHPDKCGSHCEQDMRQINVAYESLLRKHQH